MARPVAGTQSARGSHRKTSPTVENYKAHLERLGMSGELVNKEARRIKDKGRKGSGEFENQTDLLGIKKM